jgi:two-component system alkaline phosphatase synthesis response regulator PhoP
MTHKQKILIVEDEVAIRTGLVDVFVYHGYDVDYAEHGEQGLKKSLSGLFDLILLDVMLPGINGFDICRKIREQDRHQAVIMLTAKTNDEDVIQGLTLGADDYVSKPFSVTQLVLRVQAVLRRTGVNEQNDDKITLTNGVIIDSRNLSANNQTVFTRREMDVLQYLNTKSHRPVARDELLVKVWGYASHMEIETRTVDIHIAKLRRKIETDAANPVSIVTVRGAGYRLIVDVNSKDD